LTVEQISLKIGMLSMAIFPLIGIAVVLVIIRYFKKTTEEKPLIKKLGEE
jgi:uncharacterized membrane protein YuzA (DUF378 family)